MILHKSNAAELFSDEEISILIHTSPYYFTIEPFEEAMFMLGFIKVNSKMVFCSLIFENEQLVHEKFIKDGILLMIQKLDALTEEEKNNVQ